MKDSEDYDLMIVGQGLAGTTLAWTVLDHSPDLKLLVIDEDRPVTASKIAAGLMTPLTGPKLVKTQMWDTFWPVAEAFYRRREEQLHTPLLRVRPSIRLIHGEREETFLTLRKQQSDTAGMIRDSERFTDSERFQTDQRMIEMLPAAQLNIRDYLLYSQQHFENRGLFRHASIDLAKRIVPQNGSVSFPELNIKAKKVILCAGWNPPINGWFSEVAFNPSKGQILTVSIPHLNVSQPIHQKIWIAPDQQDSYRVGATFEWNDLTPEPTASATQELMMRLNEIVKCPAEVLQEQAAIRPTMKDFQPVIGFHPEHSQIGILNGLGTKGTLMAPYYAMQLTQNCFLNQPLASEVNVQRWFR